MRDRSAEAVAIRSTRSAVIALLVATALVMVVQLAFIDRFPPVFVDESWFTSAVWHWLDTGDNVDVLHLETLPEAAVGKTRSFLGQAPWWLSLRLFGLGLAQARFASWLIGGCLLFLLYRLGLRLYGAPTAAVAVLLLSLEPSFLQASHYARQDILLAVIGVATLVLALEAFARDSVALHALAGLTAGLGIEVHANGILFVGALAVLHVSRIGRRFPRAPSTWAVAAGGVLGCSVFVALHLLPSPQGYLEYNAFDLATGHKPPIAELQPMRLLKSLFLERFRLGWQTNVLGVSWMLAAAAFVVWRRRAADRDLLFYVAGSLLASILFLGKKSDLYAILTVPFLVLLVAEMTTSLLHRDDREVRNIGFALIGALVAIRVLSLSNAIWDHRQYDYSAASARLVDQLDEPSPRVLAMPTWWLGMPETDFVSWINLVNMVRMEEYDFAAAICLLEVDYLVVDDLLRSHLIDSQSADADLGRFDLSRREYQEFIARNAQLVAEAEVQGHGRIEIFRLRASSTSAASSYTMKPSWR